MGSGPAVWTDLLPARPRRCPVHSRARTPIFRPCLGIGIETETESAVERDPGDPACWTTPEFRTPCSGPAGPGRLAGVAARPPAPLDARGPAWQRGSCCLGTASNARSRRRRNPRHEPDLYGVSSVRPGLRLGILLALAGNENGGRRRQDRPAASVSELHAGPCGNDDGRGLATAPECGVPGGQGFDPFLDEDTAVRTAGRDRREAVVTTG